MRIQVKDFMSSPVITAVAEQDVEEIRSLILLLRKLLRPYLSFNDSNNILQHLHDNQGINSR